MASASRRAAAAATSSDDAERDRPTRPAVTRYRSLGDAASAVVSREGMYPGNPAQPLERQHPAGQHPPKRAERRIVWSAPA